MEDESLIFISKERKVNVSISDWANFDQAEKIALKFMTGLEVQEFIKPENIDQPDGILKNIGEKTKKLPFLSMHGPFSELVPASRDPLVRQVARIRFEQGYQLAEKMGAQHLILHTGYFPKTYPTETWIQNSFDFWVDFLADKPVPDLIHPENVYEDEPNALIELVDRVNQVFQDKMLTICLDIGHVNANSSRTFEEWILKLGNRIRYAHLHNNNGKLDDHWELGKGTIVIEEVLNLLQTHSPDAIWTIETPVADLESSLLWLQGKGYF
jgi:sugar phosphate isomerase/epimerase